MGFCKWLGRSQTVGLEHHDLGGIHVSVLRLLLSFLDFRLAFDVHKQI